MNPLKCAFGVTSGKLLGFGVIDTGEWKSTLLGMPPPKRVEKPTEDTCLYPKGGPSGETFHQRFSVLESCQNDMFGIPLNGVGGNTRAGFALRLGSLKSLISEDEEKKVFESIVAEGEREKR